MKLVRLVRACGSKPFLAVGFEVEGTKVRLVRACGSKQYHKRSLGTDLEGQARKSLWIETLKGIERTGVQWVRLVRACGSKLAPLVKNITDPGVRLVRACGSKLEGACWHERAGGVRLVRACGSKPGSKY